MFRFLIITKQMEKWTNELSFIFPNSYKCISTSYVEIRNDFIIFIIIPSILQSCGFRAEGAYIDYDTIEFNEEEKCILLPCLRYGFIAPIRELEYKLEEYGKI